MRVLVTQSARLDLKIIKNVRGPAIVQVLLNGVNRDLDHTSNEPGSVTSFSHHRYIQRIPVAGEDMPWWVEFHLERDGDGDFYEVHRLFSAATLVDQIAAWSSYLPGSI